MSSVLLTVDGAAKNFGGVKALVSASLTLYSHEIHALLGENGAGKSTLLKTLAGVHSLDAGSISLNGKSFQQGSTRTAREQGIAVIYQEPNLFPDLTLAEIASVTGRTIEIVHILGGGSQNNLLNQLTADICGITVKTGPVEATLFGNIAVQAISAGVVENLAEARALIEKSFTSKVFIPR